MRIYENISKMSENRMPQRAYYIPYDTLEKALAGKKETSDYYKLLNGKWNFKYFKRDIDVPEKIDFKDMIDVPGVWQNFGYDNHWYTNVNYHFPVDPPFVPDDNPCGVYSRDFVIDEFWSFKKTYIVFEGVATCLFLYINGQYVGFSQGSRMQAEFDITKYVHLGENNVTARVLKYCCGSYMEDQDCFRMNGIFRDVYLLSRDIDHVNDVEIKADTKSLTVSAPEYEIYDGDKCLGKTVKDPILWNAEKPHLYTVVVKSGTEYIPFKVGMREVSISTEGEFLINGVSVKFHGVNHHDIHPKFGYYLPDEFMRSELLKMKDLNINTIRTSHYPPAPEFLNIVDELGFYVIEEADIETHGFSTMHASGFGVPGYGDTPDWICKQEEWEGAFLERAQRMVERDKNHPSIVIWSMGNESNYGRNFDAMIDYCHNRDNTRKTLYERAQVINDKCNIDIRSMMYTAVSDVERFVNNGDERPFMLVEYSHAMGNGPGDVADYIEKFYANKKFIGGCIWEWADHVVMKDGVQKYGGDSGEEIHDGNFCCDGLVFSDRSYKAGTLNAKYSYQYFAAELIGDKLKI
ncbi:MAG: glycoside hydrolase family 2 TIM barrel-domain containing protein, partial [Bacillota bacterium]|nr:glycoside hydrolase family 2 TIM barrel-domain containing protein [Bacillota bacterium]